MMAIGKQAIEAVVTVQEPTGCKVYSDGPTLS